METITETQVFLLCSKYGRLCNKVMSTGTPRSDYESREQCCNFMQGAIGLFLLPVFGILDLLSYPFRKLKNKCRSNKQISSV